MVIGPCCELSPDWLSEGVSPSQAGSCTARPKRAKSPTSRQSTSAEGVEAAEAAQPAHRLGPLTLERQLGEALVEGATAGEQPVDRGECVQVGKLGIDAFELLARQPAAVLLRPGALLRVDAPVAEQQFGDAVAGAAEVDPDLLAGAGQVAGSLKGRGRDGDRGQLPGQKQTAEQLGVLAVGLDALARGARACAFFCVSVGG